MLDKVIMNIYDRRKAHIHEHASRLARSRDYWIEKNKYYYENHYSFMRFLIPEGLHILEIGSSTGRLLSELKPAKGVGIDFTHEMIHEASNNYPNLEFIEGDVEEMSFMKSLDGPFDVIVISDTIGALSNIQVALENLRHLCTPETRIVISYYSKAWEPILNLAQKLKMKMPQPEQNWLSTDDIENLLALSGFEFIKREWRQLIPIELLGIGSFVNRYIATLPVIRSFCLKNYIVARISPDISNYAKPESVTVLVPCRNEKGNIEAALRRTPKFCDDIEFMFVEGGSSDGTLEEINRVIEEYPEYDIKILIQDGKGKGDAVRKGFDNARGEVLMILDADLTMPPEDLPKYYKALESGKGEFINGTRLIYPMDDDAMRSLNHLANKIFSWLFSWLLCQNFTDTLCGTKVLRKSAYQKIKYGRSYFGEFDPFGDFDLIFGASKLNMKVVEVPVRYAGRDYGETQISRFRHGWLLVKMVVFAFRKLKAF